jgi:hypothetical protein
VFTLALVVNGIFGAEWRDLVFLGAGFVAVAGVTLSFPRWSANRAAWRAQGRQALLDRLLAAAEKLGELARAGDVARAAEARDLLKPLRDVERCLRADEDDGSSWRDRVQSVERKLELLQQQPVGLPTPASPQQHCPHCGQSGVESPFCGFCANPRPQQHRCGCGTFCYTAQPFKHCPGCGDKL